MPTPADKNYVNQSREREYVAALERAGTEIQSLRAVVAGLLLTTGPVTVTQETMDQTPNYTIDLETIEGVSYTVKALLAVAEEEEKTDDNS